MKQRIFTLLFLCLSMQSIAQAPAWMWSRSQGAVSGDFGQVIALNAAGDEYAGGVFSSDSLIIGNDTLHNYGLTYNEIFVAKYNASGTPQWAISFSGNNMDDVLGITTDASGNVYVTGAYTSDTLMVGAINLINSGPAGTRELYLVKLDPSGNVIWAKDMGGTNEDEGRDVIADNLGNVYVTGEFRSAGVTFGSSTLTPVGTGDVLLAKYDTAGNEIWAAGAGGTNYQEGSGVGTDMWGNIYITGMFYSTQVTFGTHVINNLGGGDGFIAKYDSTGTALWAKGMGGQMFDESNAIAVDQGGYAHITGAYQSTLATFGTSTLNNFGTSNSRDIFIARYDSAGTVQWARRAAGTGNETGNDIDLDGAGNVYIAAGSESATIYMGVTDSLVYTGIGAILSYANTGVYKWGTNAGDSTNGFIMSLACDIAGSVRCIGGYDTDSLHVGTNPVLTNAGGYDIFVGRLANPVSVSNIQTVVKEHLLVYPNPTRGSFTVSLPAGAQSLQIVNIAGQVIISEIVNGKGTAEYQLPQSGLYFVIVNTTEGKIAGKVSISN